MPGDLRPAERRLARRAAVGIADLGRNPCLADERSALERKPLAEDGFARSAAVGVCGVEPVEPQPTGAIEQLQRLVFAVARAAQAGRRADAAEIAAAEPDSVDIALTQHPVISHVCPSGPGARR